MDEKEVKIILPPDPEPIIGYESLFGIKYMSQDEFRRNYIQMKDGRHRKRRWFDKPYEENTSVYNGIMGGLNDAIEHANGNLELTVHRIDN